MIITGVLGSVIGEIVCKLFRIFKNPLPKVWRWVLRHTPSATSKAMEMGPVEGAMEQSGHCSRRSFDCGQRLCICAIYVIEMRDRMMENFIITIGRQAGSGGREIGMRLARRAWGFPTYGRQELYGDRKRNAGLRRGPVLLRRTASGRSLLYAIATSNVEERSGTHPLPEDSGSCAAKPPVFRFGRCGGHIFRGEKRQLEYFFSTLMRTFGPSGQCRTTVCR